MVEMTTRSGFWLFWDRAMPWVERVSRALNSEVIPDSQIVVSCRVTGCHMLIWSFGLLPIPKTISSTRDEGLRGEMRAGVMVVGS